MQFRRSMLASNSNPNDSDSHCEKETSRRKIRGPSIPIEDLCYVSLAERNGICSQNHLDGFNVQTEGAIRAICPFRLTYSHTPYDVPRIDLTSAAQIYSNPLDILQSCPVSMMWQLRTYFVALHSCSLQFRVPNDSGSAYLFKTRKQQQ